MSQKFSMMTGMKTLSLDQVPLAQVTLLLSLLKIPLLLSVLFSALIPPSLLACLFSCHPLLIVIKGKWRGHDVAVKKVFVQASIVDTRMNVINEVEILSSVHSPYLVCYYSPLSWLFRDS